MNRTPKTLLITGAALAATSIGLLTFAQAQNAAPPGVDPSTHAAHLQQNPATHAPGVQPDWAGDASADLASQVAALRGEVAEIRMMLKQQYAAPARANAGGGAGMSTVPMQPGGGQMQPMQPMQPQPSQQTGGMAGMSAGGSQPAPQGMAMAAMGKMQRPMANGQARSKQAQPAAGAMAGMGGGSKPHSGPKHDAQHAQPNSNAGGDEHADLVSQMAVMRADVSRLQAALAQGHTAYAPTAASGGMAKGMGGMDMDKMQKRMGSGQMQSPQPPPPMQSQPGPGGAGAGGMPGMSGGGQPAPGGMAPMQDDQMDMGGMAPMPDDQMGMGAMGGGAPASAQPAAGGMGMMDMDKMEMGGMGAAPAGGQPAGGGMSGMAGGAGGGGMGMDAMMQKMQGMMKMMGMGDMMGMGGGGAMPMGGAGSPAAMAMPSALPGFPGASHIYHIGATGFFLDHPEHITLTLEQQTELSQKREQALLQQAQFQRRVEEAEQELWVLTAADQPDAAAIDTKVQQVAKLQGDQRIAFIRAAGEAAKVLTDEQRKQLTGMLPPMPMTPAPAAPAMPATPGMPDM